MKKIIFTPIFNVDHKYYPSPASKNIPDWYKNTDSFHSSRNFMVKDGYANLTIKKCIPVFDAMTAGYIISTYVDIYVSQEENGPYYSWPSQVDPISFHPIIQAELHPSKNNFPYPKWSNPWSIKTDAGYSTLFVPPMHNPNKYFTIMPGVVDTDTYLSPVNFPFVLNDKDFKGIIPAGTPMAQIIPFKRDFFKSEIGNEKMFNNIKKFESTYFTKWFNNYKSRFWNKKQYK